MNLINESTLMHPEKITLIAGALALAGAASASIVTEYFSSSVPENRPVISGSSIVNPAYGKKSSGNPRRLGENNPLQPPFCETFDNFRAGMEHDDIHRYFDIIDSNNDGRSWGMYNYAGDRPYGKCSYLVFPTDGQPADDWLITRAIRLEKGKYYCVSVYAGLFIEGNKNTPEIFEVKIGNYNDAAGMKTTVIPATNVTSQTMKRVAGWFSPKVTANYYIGVHGISPTYSNYYNYLFIDNIGMDAPKTGREPGMVSGVEMTNDPNGTSALNIRFTAPDKAIDGSDLGSLTSITVMRGKKEIGRIDSPEPGKAYDITDTPDKEDTYEYSFTASNEAGEGAVYYQTHTTGIAKPVAPEVIAFKELENGKIKLEWTAPANDVNGNAINPAMVRYNVDDIRDNYTNTVAQLTDKLELTYDADVEEGRQRAAMCKISAVLNGKESDYTVTNMIPVGTPYKLPYRNSFTVEDYYKHVMLMDAQDDVTWRMLDDNSDPHAQDGDNGYICMIGSQPGQSCELRTGKIDMTETGKPILSFYTYVYSDDENIIRINATDWSTGQKIQTTKVDLSQFPRVGWHKVNVPLAECTGKIVSVGIQGEIVTHGYIPVDNLRIEQMHSTDLAVSNVDAPLRAEVNEPFDVFVSIFNNGIEEVSDYTVTLMAGDREIATVTGEPVASLDEVIVELSDSFNAVSPASTEYRVVVSADGDENPENNESEPFTVVFSAPIHPTVTTLEGTEDGDNVTLTWSAPDLSKAAPEEAFEDFERYEAFSNELDGWTMFDGDEGFVAGFENLTMPVNGTQQAFWVMSAVDEYSFIPTVSGINALVAMYAFDSRNMSIPSDEWLISPELYGGRQTVDFWATSLTENYGCEQIEVYYSTTGNNIVDFKPVMGLTEVPDTWTRYFVALPEGTKHFAIRYVSENRFMLLLDDITYIPAGEPRGIELKGYNVYRNGVKLNQDPVTGTSYATTRDMERDEYFVTVVYDLGESTGSNVVKLGFGSVSDINADDSTSPVELYNLQGIKVDPATAAHGVYLRRTGTSVSKVVVK